MESDLPYRYNYEKSETMADFIRGIVTDTGDLIIPKDFDIDFRQIVLADARGEKGCNKHLFHLSFRTINGKEYLFVNDTLSLLQWGPHNFMTLIFVTQDLPTIKWFVMNKYFENEEIKKKYRDVIIFTANPELMRLFITYEYTQELFDAAPENWSAIYPILCQLVHYVITKPELVDYHKEKIELFINLMNNKIGVDVMGYKDYKELLRNLLSDETVGVMKMHVENFRYLLIADFEQWRQHLLKYANEDVDDS